MCMNAIFFTFTELVCIRKTLTNIIIFLKHESNGQKIFWNQTALYVHFSNKAQIQDTRVSVRTEGWWCNLWNGIELLRVEWYKFMWWFLSVASFHLTEQNQMDIYMYLIWTREKRITIVLVDNNGIWYILHHHVLEDDIRGIATTTLLQ